MNPRDLDPHPADGQAAPLYTPGLRGEAVGAYEAGDEGSDAESEEEQSGLIVLLQQIPLAELREIARQRGWRVRGTSKADYVSALASLLCDPTETARAVTGMTEDLREALRAAFVADDGSGITATTMAQTMTALRGAAGPTIKPVEAAALLRDLACWGIVLQWRDSLYGEGRHVLPWEVQRLVPPLPGWCPPTPEAPGTPTRYRDPRQTVDRLCALWKSIAAGQPAVRPSLQPRRDTALSPRGTRAGVGPDRLPNRRFSSLVQDWPYDPQELLDWTANHRRADTPVPTLSVPPSPLLVEDTVLSILARSVDSQSPAAGDGQSPAKGAEEQPEFLCRVLCELDLVSIQDGHLMAQREEMTRFLQLSLPDQHRTIAQAYLSLLDWSELDLLLRQDTRLILWRRPYFFIPYEQFRSLLVRLRHLLLRFLACAGEDGWCRLTDIETALRKLWPQFAAPMQSENQSWFAQAWGLAWRQEEREPGMAETTAPQHDATTAPRLPSRLGGAEYRPIGAGHLPGEASTPPRRDSGSVDWPASQGTFLRAMLEGPLYWLGFAELSYSGGQLAAFRLHGLANWIWDRPVAESYVEGQPEALTIDEAAGTIAMPPGSVPPQAHTFLGRFTRLEEASPERFVYRLHPLAALAAFESGMSLSDLLAEWERVISQPIPAALRETLREFWTRYGQVRLYDGFSLLELSDEVTLRELEAGTSLSRHIVARLSPRLVLVPDEAVETLMREFAAKDYTPKELE